MENLEFTNPDTKEKFQCLVGQDRDVHKAQVYSGKLSAITPEMAKAMVEGGSNLVKEKSPATKPPEVKPAKPGDGK